MSLSKDALDTITANAIAASGAALDTYVPAVLVPKDYKVQNLDQLQARPAHFRGTFDTSAIEPFVHYVTQHASAESAGFIDPESMSARVIFDHGNARQPGHGHHTARLQLNPTPAYAAMRRATGETFSQKDLTEWLEDWAPFITTESPSGDTLPLPVAIDAIRRMRIETKGERVSEISDVSAKRSALEDIEAKSQGQLPAGCVFACVPYHALGNTAFRLRLAVLTGGDTPKFRLRWLQQDIDIERIATRFHDSLSHDLADTLPLTLGTFA